MIEGENTFLSPFRMLQEPGLLAPPKEMLQVERKCSSGAVMERASYCSGQKWGRTSPSSLKERGLKAVSWRRPWQPTPVLLPGKSHGQRSLVGCSLWGWEESDTTERLHFPFSLSCTGEGNGNPLRCSCLENPRDDGAWWAAVCGVAQSRTRLK